MGATGNLTATARDTNGNLVPLTTSATAWESRDTAIARVNGDGLVTAVKSGSTLIVFTDNESGKTDSALVVIP